jgi:hypothetical protein
LRAAIALLALAGCQSGDAPKAKQPPAVETLALDEKPPAVGLVIHEDSSDTSSMTISLGGQSSVLTEELHEKSRSEVLEVANGAITKIRIEYEVKETKHAIDGKETLEPSPLEGHTYEVWTVGGELKAARADGAAVSDAEAAALADDHADLGRVPPLARVIPGRTWKKSEKVELSTAELAGLTDDPALAVTAASFMFLGEGGGAAVFDTLATYVKDDADGRVETTVNGKMQIDLTTVRPTDVTRTGKSHGVLHGKMEGATLDGSTEGRAQYRYE